MEVGVKSLGICNKLVNTVCWRHYNELSFRFTGHAILPFVLFSFP